MQSVTHPDAGISHAAKGDKDVLSKLHQTHQLLRHFGPAWLCYRGIYVLRRRSGLLRRELPTTRWEQQPLDRFLQSPLSDLSTYLEYRKEQSPRFLLANADRQSLRQRCDAWDAGTVNPVRLAESLRNGKLRFFERLDLDVGWPPQCHLNPVTGQTSKDQRHWSQIGDFENGDIKLLWEPSRFGFVFTLVRAYWRTGDERFAEMFWQAVENWRSENPPQAGVHWKCGQEISLRVMAWCFGLYGFLTSETTTPDRVAALAQMIAVSGERIAANISYGVSQKNNHGMSEAAGLWTIGLLFPEFRSAAAWSNTGRKLLESQAKELIYADGAFSQHSTNYHRLMLQLYLWAIRLGELNSKPLSSEVVQQVQRAGDFLYHIQDPDSGKVPCYGHNDGALFLPLSNCDYQDYRPVVQATQFLTSGRRCFHDGPWDEDLFWLFGSKALDAAVVDSPRRDFAARVSGYYTLRSTSSFAFLRAGRFVHRPAQADSLHLDLWWRGQNIALDAGTYSYNAPEPWDNRLAHSRYHNTVVVDDQDQMPRVSRFLWMPWLHAEVKQQMSSTAGQLSYWRGAHDGYLQRGLATRYTRTVLRIGDEHWLVCDYLDSPVQHDYRLHWLLCDASCDAEEPTRIVLQTPSGGFQVQVASSVRPMESSVLRADPSGPRGWRSAYYMHREPALSAEFTVHARAAAFWTVFGPKGFRFEVADSNLRIATPDWEASLSRKASSLPLDSVTVSGTIDDRLEF
jgi:hypothetical protein